MIFLLFYWNEWRIGEWRRICFGFFWEARVVFEYKKWGKFRYFWLLFWGVSEIREYLKWIKNGYITDKLIEIVVCLIFL